MIEDEKHAAWLAYLQALIDGDKINTAILADKWLELENKTQE